MIWNNKQFILHKCIDLILSPHQKEDELMDHIRNTQKKTGHD